jgi:hypothetical protein
MATKGTLAERVRGRPPSRLVSGELLPGSRFKMTYFGTEYGVSLSVVRQAVTQAWREPGLDQATSQRRDAAKVVVLVPVHALDARRPAFFHVRISIHLRRVSGRSALYRGLTAGEVFHGPPL